MGMVSSKFCCKNIVYIRRFLRMFNNFATDTENFYYRCNSVPTFDVLR